MELFKSCLMQQKCFIKIRHFHENDKNSKDEKVCARWSPLQRRLGPIIGLKPETGPVDEPQPIHTHSKGFRSSTSESSASESSASKSSTVQCKKGRFKGKCPYVTLFIRKRAQRRSQTKQTNRQRPSRYS